MSIRRLFWLGAAILFSIAALVAIAAVLGGSFGATQGHILETCGIAFVCGATALAGLACVDRGVIVLVGWVAVALGLTSFVTWTAGAWSEPSSDGFWKVAGLFGVWTFAALIVTTLALGHLLAARAPNGRPRDVGGGHGRRDARERDDPRRETGRPLEGRVRACDPDGTRVRVDPGAPALLGK